MDMDLNELEDILKLKIEENVKMVFFDNIASDILDNNFESSFNILSEIKTKLCQVVPNRKDIHRELDDNIDVAFYRKVQSNNALDHNMIHGIMFFIIEKIKMFGFIEDECWNDIWKTQIHVKINKNEPLNILLSEFFKEAMHRIDKIEWEINDFKQSDIYKIITEKNENKPQ